MKRWMLAFVAVGFLSAHSSGRSQQAQDPSIDANRGAVGVITGMADGTYLKTGADLTILDSDTLRVLPIVGRGSLSNLRDILYLRGVDFGFVQSDVLTYARQRHLFTDLDRVRYISALYQEEVHILARQDITDLAALAGQRVNVDVVGSGSAMSAEIVLQALGLNATLEHRKAPDALELLRRGEIAAVIHVGGAPIPLYAGIAAGSGLHFLSVPLNPDLAKTYLPGELTHERYPNLVGDGQSVPTIAVEDVMAVYGWPQQTERYAKVARFINAFFSRFGEFQRPPRHPKWREVSLLQTVPGWTRFQAADEWLRAALPKEPDMAQTIEQFRRFIGKDTMSADQRAAWLRQMQDWMQTR